jgi:hypothetical protein
MAVSVIRLPYSRARWSDQSPRRTAFASQAGSDTLRHETLVHRLWQVRPRYAFGFLAGAHRSDTPTWAGVIVLVHWVMKRRTVASGRRWGNSPSMGNASSPPRGSKRGGSPSSRAAACVGRADGGQRRCDHRPQMSGEASGRAGATLGCAEAVGFASGGLSISCSVRCGDARSSMGPWPVNAGTTAGSSGGRGGGR